MNESATDKAPAPENPSEPTEPKAADTPATDTPAPGAPATGTPGTDTSTPASPAEPPPPTATPPPLPPVPPVPPVPAAIPPPASPPRPSTRLVRSRSDKMIGGVCGGLAKVLNIDPLILRLALVLATVLGFGAGVVLYIACWILMPEGDR